MPLFGPSAFPTEMPKFSGGQQPPVDMNVLRQAAGMPLLKGPIDYSGLWGPQGFAPPDDPSTPTRTTSLRPGYLPANAGEALRMMQAVPPGNAKLVRPVEAPGGGGMFTSDPAQLSPVAQEVMGRMPVFQQSDPMGPPAEALQPSAGVFPRDAQGNAGIQTDIGPESRFQPINTGVYNGPPIPASGYFSTGQPPAPPPRVPDRYDYMPQGTMFLPKWEAFGIKEAAQAAEGTMTRELQKRMHEDQMAFGREKEDRLERRDDLQYAPNRLAPAGEMNLMKLLLDAGVGLDEMPEAIPQAKLALPTIFGVTLGAGTTPQAPVGAAAAAAPAGWKLPRGLTPKKIGEIIKGEASPLDTLIDRYPGVFEANFRQIMPLLLEKYGAKALNQFLAEPVIKMPFANKDLQQRRELLGEYGTLYQGGRATEPEWKSTIKPGWADK